MEPAPLKKEVPYGKELSSLFDFNRVFDQRKEALS
jgi:hypothetical protein